jgi:hypothetical protein
MRSIVYALSASALLFLAPAALRAEDAPPSPAERTAKVLKSMPAPSAKAGFKTDLQLLANGVTIGSGHLEAAPDMADGKPVWKLTENFVIEVGPPKKLHNETKEIVAQDLHVLHGEDKQYAEGEDGTTVTAVRTEKGYDLTTKGPEGEKSSSIEADTQTLGSISTMLLFLRNCPAEPALYDVHVLSEEKGEIHTGTVEVKGPGKFSEGDTTFDAWTVSGKVGEHSFEVYLDPADRSLLALRMVEPGVVMLKAGILKAAAPAASAIECGARLALAILTSDEALLAGAIHWPSMFADAKATKAYAGDEAEYKKLIMDGFRTSFKTLAHADAVARVKGAADGAKETVTGDVTVVTFGAPMDKFTYSAQLIDGGWYIIKFPD